MTDLLDAIFNCDLNKLKIFCSDTRNVNLQIPGTEGCTPLHIIVGIENNNRKDQVLTYLLEIGADPNARSFDDLTPVHIASMWNNCSELDKLLQNGGNPWLTDNENKNSFDLAIDNHAYEAYQLLNRYLSEDKLNFRNGLCKVDIKPSYCEQPVNDNKVAMIDDFFTDNSFCTANENFPFYFSATEDESEDFLLNVSKILKKNVTRIENQKQKVDNKISGRSITARKITSNQNSIELANDTDASGDAMECNKGTRVKTRATAHTLPTSNDTESCNTSENEYTIPKSEGSETVVDSDNSSGIVLVEKYTSPYTVKKYERSGYCNTTASDWKAYQSRNNSSSFIDSCLSHNNSNVAIPDDYKLFSNSKIFQELKKFGDDPGPISDSTREIYLRRLAKLKSGCDVSCVLPAPKYCPEVYMFLEGKLDSNRMQNWMNTMNEEFKNLDPNEKWREGNQRYCFNYFLLDPRVTQNLPTRLKFFTFEKALLTFLDSIFYVGKGTKGRPYSHLIEAAKAAADLQSNKSDKVSHILDVWESGYGVISLHCFNNCVPVEAYTHEACIIEAIGLENLTNLKPGDYYGKSVKWKRSFKRQVGVALLHKALQIFILEGEKQILPKDVRMK